MLINKKERVKMRDEEKLEEFQKVLPSEGVISVRKLATYFTITPAELYEELIDKDIPVFRLGTRQDDGLVNMKVIYNKTLTKKSHGAFAGGK